MTDNTTHEIRSPAVGQRIVGLRYDADSGFLAVLLDSGSELWVSASYEDGYHVYVAEHNAMCGG